LPPANPQLAKPPIPTPKSPKTPPCSPWRSKSPSTGRPRPSPPMRSPPSNSLSSTPFSSFQLSQSLSRTVEVDMGSLRLLSEATIKYHEDFLNGVASTATDTYAEYLDTVSGFISSSRETIKDVRSRAESRRRKARQRSGKVHAGEAVLDEEVQRAQQRLEGLQAKLSLLYSYSLLPSPVEGEFHSIVCD
ncbi:hypothetical protein V5O48_019256, partial [Marasmius crinis-equi]